MSASSQTISSSPSVQPKQKSCSNCRADFPCGPASAEESCWCEALPHVSLVARADQDCLCPPCLSEAIAKLAKAGADISSSTGLQMASAPTLIADEDYYCEGAAIVFTAHYLLRRGYCCESGCRHCPYESAQVNKEAVTAKR